MHASGVDGVEEEHRHLLDRLAELERLARDQDAQLQMIYERVREYAVFTVDAAGNVASWNSSGARLTGRAPDQILGQPLASLWVDDEAPDRSHLEAAARHGWAEHSGWCRRGDDQRFWAEAVTSALREGGVVDGFTVVLRDSTDRKSYEERLHHLSITDELTSLPNRRHFLELLASVLGAHDRYGHTLALVVTDVDSFKHVNEEHGRLGGDDALRYLARIVREQCRAADVAARVSGDRFALLLPSTTAEQAVRLAERIRRAVDRQPIPFDSGTAHLTVSVGVAEARPGDDVAGLFERAELALEEAKRLGRNRVVAAP